jgi:peptidoglycan/xylan/chitin deacetylase (PgdA/CDA1 family)
MKLHWRGRLARVGATCAILLGVLQAGAGVAQAAPATVVSLTFNDAFISQYTYARPVLQSHAMNGTFYVTTGSIDKGYGCCVAWWQADNLYRDGNEIGGLGRDRIDLTQVYNADWTQDKAYKQAQVCDDRQRLAQLGYDPRSFAYPYGASNYTFPDGSTVKGLVQGCGYLSGRPIGGLSSSGPTYAETLPPQDAYGLRTWNSPGSSPITLTSLQDAVTAAASNGGGWVPFAFNEVCHQGSAEYSSCMSSYLPIDDAVFSAFLDWLKNTGQAGGAPAGTVVQTVRQAMGAPAQPPLPVRPTVVSVTFDDGLASQFQARSILRTNNARATFYLVSGDIDNRDPGAMTWGNARTLLGDGNDMGGHTAHHVNLTDPGLTYDQKVHEICDDRQRLIQQKLTNPASFAYPFGALDATAEGIVQACGYRSGRSAGGLWPTGPRVYGESIPPRDAFGIWALNAENDGPITLAWLQSAVTGAASHGGGWVPMLFHEVCYPGTANYNACMAAYRPVSSTVLTQFLAWMRLTPPAGATIKTVRQVMGA